MEAGQQIPAIEPPEGDGPKTPLPRNDRYLDYVRVMRERIANQARQNGVTKWALTGAVLFLLFKLIPDLGKISSGELEARFLWLTFAHAQSLVVGAYLAYNALRGRTSATRLDYRFRVADSPRENWQMLVSIGPLFLWLALTAGVSVYAGYATSALEDKVLLFTAILFGFVFFILLVVTIVGHTKAMSRSVLNGGAG